MKKLKGHSQGCKGALASLWWSIRILMSTLSFVSPRLPSCQVFPPSKHHQREAERQHLRHFFLRSIRILQLRPWLFARWERFHQVHGVGNLEPASSSVQRCVSAYSAHVWNSCGQNHEFWKAILILALFLISNLVAMNELYSNFPLLEPF